MAVNGRLDVSTLVDWDGHQNYLTPEAAAQWIAFRNAYADATGYWLYTSECYRPVGNPGDYAAGNVNTQWYWFEYYNGDSRMAAYPGSTSSHGFAVAMDLVGWPERDILIALAAQYGFEFDVSYELWHLHYVGNPSTSASLNITPLLNTQEQELEYFVTVADNIVAAIQGEEKGYDLGDLRRDVLAALVAATADSKSATRRDARARLYHDKNGKEVIGINWHSRHCIRYTSPEALQQDVDDAIAACVPGPGGNGFVPEPYVERDRAALDVLIARCVSVESK